MDSRGRFYRRRAHTAPAARPRAAVACAHVLPGAPPHAAEHVSRAARRRAQRRAPPARSAGAAAASVPLPPLQAAAAATAGARPRSLPRSPSNAWGCGATAEAGLRVALGSACRGPRAARARPGQRARPSGFGGGSARARLPGAVQARWGRSYGPAGRPQGERLPAGARCACPHACLLTGDLSPPPAARAPRPCSSAWAS